MRQACVRRFVLFLAAAKASQRLQIVWAEQIVNDLCLWNIVGAANVEVLYQIAA